jgi:hypothetical protein
VRENFMIASIIVGLCYSYINPLNQGAACRDVASHEVGNVGISKSPLFKWAIIGVFLAALLGGFREIYQSFGRYPFNYGVDCFVNRPLTKDLWTSGRYEFALPERSHSIDLDLGLNRPYIAKSPLQIQVDLINPGNRLNALQSFRQLRSGEIAHFSIEIPSNVEILQPALGRLSVSSCFTPRNLGINTDGRRLGVQLLKPVAMK